MSARRPAPARDVPAPAKPYTAEDVRRLASSAPPPSATQRAVIGRIVREALDRTARQSPERRTG
jgi:hypothetical protein